jgi:hypothetical protein
VVLPRLVTAHEAHLDALSPVTDGPVRRTLLLQLPEERADLAEGEALLASRSTADGGSTAAERAVAALERLLM